jgi:hypothetical protein
MGRAWSAIKTSKIPQWPYPELAKIEADEFINFYKNVAYQGNDYKLQKIKEENRNHLYNRLGFSLTTVLISYSIVFIVIILLIIHVANWLHTYKPV